MKAEILEFILGGIYEWENDKSLGEEVRALEHNLIDEINGKDEPVLNHLLYLIYRYDSDKNLGSEVRKIHLPILIAYDKALTCRNINKG